MLTVGWRAATGQQGARRLRLSPLRQLQALRGVQMKVPPRTPNSRLRVQQPQSRAAPQLVRPYQLPHQYAQLRWKHASSKPSKLSTHSHLQPLQSRFPTKTVIFLLVLAGLYYVSDISIELSEGIGLRLFSVFSNEPTAFPLHLYGSREEVEHMIDHHMLDFADPGLRDPDFARLVNDEFERNAFGWAMSEEEARESGMPVTHGVRFRSNEPCEDYFALGTSPGPGNQPWNFWGVYDGHAGKYTANFLQWSLVPHVSRSISSLPATTDANTLTNAIMRTFVRLDEDMMNRARNAAHWYPAASSPAITALTPAFSGSCALLSCYNPSTSTLLVANVGDSRAVLGRWDPATESYTCRPLSADQTGFNQLEYDRITAEHPDEDNIIDKTTGRLLGIAVTRAFGDHRWKWDNDFIRQLQIKFWGPAPRPNSKTPPYMTAEPVITETEIVSVEKGERRSDFMIMASDGLWDRISSENAVLLVQKWLEAKQRGNGSVLQDPQFEPPTFTERQQLDRGVEYDVEEGKEIDWKATPEYFSIEDENAAVCLARNAMGGSRKGLFMGVLSVPPPLCRMAVDDTTIMVVFFDKLGNGKDKGVKKGASVEMMVEGQKRWWWPW